MTYRPEVEAQLQNPNDLARIAGKDIYGTSVGALRRTELYRLGNAWGMNFPVGASKDYMLPFFKELEARGKNPLRPPTGGTLDEVVKRREATFDGTHVDDEVVPAQGLEPQFPESKSGVLPLDEAGEGVIAPQSKSEFEQRLEGLHHGQLKKICKMRGIEQSSRDRKPDLIARIVAASEGNDFEQDLP